MEADMRRASFEKSVLAVIIALSALMLMTASVDKQPPHNRVANNAAIYIAP